MRGRGARAEDPDARCAQLVGETEHQRHLRPDHDQIHGERARERDLPRDVIDLDGVALADQRDTRVAGCRVDLEAERTRADHRDERMLPPARADDENPQRALRATASMPCGART